MMTLAEWIALRLVKCVTTEIEIADVTLVSDVNGKPVMKTQVLKTQGHIEPGKYLLVPDHERNH